jgi:hypothetical protein
MFDSKTVGDNDKYSQVLALATLGNATQIELFLFFWCSGYSSKLVHFEAQLKAIFAIV